MEAPMNISGSLQQVRSDGRPDGHRCGEAGPQRPDSLASARYDLAMQRSRDFSWQEKGPAVVQGRYTNNETSSRCRSSGCRKRLTTFEVAIDGAEICAESTSWEAEVGLM
jgi:hypothetical protein